MNDFNTIHALYHSEMAKRELERQKRNLEILNTDFLVDLPSPIRDIVDQFRWGYSNRKWFPEAWEEYRKHVLESGLGGKIKMPGAVFNKYLDKYELKELEKEFNTSVMHSEELCEDFLAHHGVKGQKWGIRRYQNEDGTLTEEGKARLDAGGNIAKGVKDAAESAKQIPTSSGKMQRGQYPDMTDKELEDRVKRMSLEQRYSDLAGDTKYVKSGGEKAKEILQTVGAIAGIGASAIAIAKAIFDMRHRAGKKAL